MSEKEPWQLTPEETALIEQYLDFYRALDTLRQNLTRRTKPPTPV